GIYYFGYFDCALSTYCPTGVCNNSSDVLGCLKAGDSRVDPTKPAYYLPLQYVAAPCGANTGMVISGTTGLPVKNSVNIIGTVAAPVVTYVMHPSGPSMAVDGSGAPTATIGPQDTYLNGTLVVEGNVTSKNKADLCTNGPAPSSPLPANSCPT